MQEVFSTARVHLAKCVEVDSASVNMLWCNAMNYYSGYYGMPYVTDIHPLLCSTLV